MDGATWAVLSKTKNCSFLKIRMYNWTVPYLIYDDFLEAEDFEFVQDYAERVTNNLSLNNKLIEEKIHDSWQSHNWIKIANTHKPICNEPAVINLYDKYSPQLMSMLCTLSLEKLKLADYHTISLIVTEPNAEYPVHLDSPNKLLSCVLYVSEDNIGTMLYSTKDKQDPYEVEWKPNRLFVFSRSDDSWHSWNSNDDYRATLVWNIMLDG